jgi:NADP-dependent 3-hydroxy acid dehydrogenase YdfG
MGITEFKKQVAVVTGASSGVGRSIALSLGNHQASLALLGRREEALEGAALECTGAGAVRTYRVDLEDVSQVASFCRQVLNDLGRVDILVHSAGIIAPGKWEEANLDDLDRQYRCNVRGPYALTQGLLSSLRAAQGQVVFINSSAGLTARPGISQYGATKHALRALADSLRDEVNDDGVRVVTLYLGRTATPMQERLHEFEGKPYFPEQLIQPNQVASLVVDILATSREEEITEVRLRPTKKPAP